MHTLTIVTGGSSGLGRALLAASPEPATRVDVSRSGPPPEADEHVAADLADPATWASVGRSLATLIEREAAQRVVVIHNAGTLEPIGFAGEVEGAAYARSVLLGSAAGQVLGHHVLAALAGRDVRAQLAMISSGAARSAYPGWSAYGAGKAALEQWVRTVGEEQRRRGGVQVLAIGPGVVATPMQSAIRATDARDFPNVERFHQLHEDGELLAPEVAARKVWSVLDDPSLESGAVTDVRDR